MLDERDLRLLDDILSRSPLAVVAWDADYRISYWSHRAEKMFGYPADRVLGKTAETSGLVLPEDLPSVLEVREQIASFDRMRAIVNVNRNVRPDGEVRTCRWTTVAVQQNERYHVLSYAEDITDALRADLELRESEERFRSLFEYNPDITMIFSPDGTIVDVNEAILRFGPTPREHIRGLHFSAFIVPEDVPRHEMYLQRALQGETVFYASRVRNLEGVDLDVSITTVPLYRDGKIDGVFSIIRDETEQRLAAIRIQNQEREIADSEARLRSLFEHNPDAVLAVSPSGVITDVNDATLAIGGFPRAAVVGEQFTRFLPPEDIERTDAAFARALTGETISLSVHSFKIDGAPLDLNVTLIPQRAGGSVVGVYAIAQDTTERRAAERRAERQSERIRNLYFISTSGDYPDVRMQASLEMGCSAFGVGCGAIVEITGNAARVDAVYRNPDAETVSDDEIAALARSAIEAAGTSETPIILPNGVALRLNVGGEFYGALIFATDDDGPRDFSRTDADLLGLISTLIAGTIDRSRQRARLRAMAYYDALSGLPNRVYLSEKLRDAVELAQAHASRVALLFLDLDRFKDVNDTLGHARGDRLLQMVALRLIKELGDNGTIARMGGDEFVVLLSDCGGADEVREVADKIIAAISEPFLLDEYEQYISTSIGISIYPEDGRDDQTLIKNADIAMYRAKERGRNGYYFYNPTLEAPIQMRLSQEKLLRRALDLNEFVVYYQPQIDLRSGQIVSVEALVRWNHPKSGLIAPGHFIPSAELSGLIVPLGDWVLATAAKQVKEWHRDLGNLRLAVNLSGRQFHQRDLRRRVLKSLEDAGLEPPFLEIEITESVAMSDAAQTDNIVRELKASGIRTAVDDFGTGYSSLAYLRRFALDVLKIDGSFVKGLGSEAFDETIVKTVIGMAHSLGLEVVAEGVETAVQLQFLEDNRCDIVQGYAISPPLAAADFETFMQRRPRGERRFGVT